MGVDRKIAMVVTQIRMEDEDSLDVTFWMAQTPAKRLEEVCRLRKNYFTWANGFFPAKIEKVVHQQML
jgi:hypothetical protein